MASRDHALPLRAAWLAQHLGVEAQAATPVGGGCIHSAWCLTVAPLSGPSQAAPAGPTAAWPEGGRLFLKTNLAARGPMLEAEAEGLRALAVAAAGSGVGVPQPLAVGVDGAVAALALPWHNLHRASSDRAWAALGEGVARLHQASLERVCTPQDRPDRFGWHGDNWIGSGVQHNGWEDSWGRFFAQRRLAPQLALLARNGSPLEGAEALLERVPAWLAGHRCAPALVHGDLWSGNVAHSEAGPLVFDPAVHRGDREVDLAMARLFGGFPSAFFAGYERIWPLPPGHGERVALYNLYHLLNHANLFGDGYQVQAQASIRQLLASNR